MKAASVNAANNNNNYNNNLHAHVAAGGAGGGGGGGGGGGRFLINHCRNERAHTDFHPIKRAQSWLITRWTTHVCNLIKHRLKTEVK